MRESEILASLMLRFLDEERSACTFLSTYQDGSFYLQVDSNIDLTPEEAWWVAGLMGDEDVELLAEEAWTNKKEPGD